MRKNTGHHSPRATSGCCDSEGCGGIDRRDFVKAIGLGSAAIAALDSSSAVPLPETKPAPQLSDGVLRAPQDES